MLYPFNNSPKVRNRFIAIWTGSLFYAVKQGQACKFPLHFLLTGFTMKVVIAQIFVQSWTDFSFYKGQIYAARYSPPRRIRRNSHRRIPLGQNFFIFSYEKAGAVRIRSGRSLPFLRLTVKSRIISLRLPFSFFSPQVP